MKNALFKIMYEPRLTVNSQWSTVKARSRQLPDILSRLPEQFASQD